MTPIASGKFAAIALAFAGAGCGQSPGKPPQAGAQLAATIVQTVGPCDAAARGAMASLERINREGSAGNITWEDLPLELAQSAESAVEGARLCRSVAASLRRMELTGNAAICVKMADEKARLLEQVARFLKNPRSKVDQVKFAAAYGLVSHETKKCAASLKALQQSASPAAG